MSHRIIALDVLRAVAVLLVLGRHVPLGAADGEFFRAWQHVGWIGVDLFFVLSGYLVSGILFDEYRRRRAVHPVRFLVRRGFKIYPLFYALVAVTAYASVAPMRLVVHEATFTQNYLGGVWSHTWSLAVEEHFYLLLALVCYWSARRRLIDKRCFIVGVVVAMVFAFALRVVALARNPHAWTVFQTQFRMDALCAGVELAWIQRFVPRVWTAAMRWSSQLLVAAVALLLPSILCPVESHFVQIVGLTCNSLAFAIVVFLAVTTEWEPGRFFARVADALAVIGVYSYSIYLWHMPCLDVLEQRLPATRSRASFMTIFVGVAIAVGVVMSCAIERPLLEIRRRIYSTPT